VPKNSRNQELEIIVVCTASFPTLPGTLIAHAPRLILSTWSPLARALLPLSSALDSAALPGRFTLLLAALSLLALSLLTLRAGCGGSTLGLLVTLIPLLIHIS
jgi:hypothetical protein